MRTIISILVALVLGLGMVPAVAQTAPADSAIKGALYDIQRAEQQIKTLTPARTANIKRLQRSVGMAEKRLRSSGNKGHASWKEAESRLNNVKQALDALAAGRMPGAAPAQATAPSAPPPAAPSAAAAASSDPQVAAARKEIDRIAGELSKMQTPNRALLRRYSIQLNAAGNRLKSARDKSDPAWRAAAKAYNAANDRIRAMAKAPAAKSGGTAQAGPAKAPAASDPAVGRATREMNLLERQIAGQRSVTGRGAKRYLTELYRIGKGLAAVKDREQASWKQAAARYQTLKNKIVDLNIGILRKRYQSLSQRIGKMTPVKYMLAREVDPLRKELHAIYRETKGLAAPRHPGVQKLAGELERTNETFEASVKSAIAARQQHGDVAGRLAQIRKRVHEIKVPTLNSSPVTEAQVRDFVRGIAAVKEHIKTDGAYLASIEGKVPLTVPQGNAFRFAKSSLAHGKPAKIKRATSIAITTIDLWVKHENSYLEFIEKTDPNDPNHRANRLLAKGRYQENLKRLAKSHEAVKMAALFDKEMGRTDGPDRAAQLKRVEAAIDAYKGKFKTALSGNRMPEAKSTSSKLRKVVAEVLAKPKYGYKYERYVINADLRSLEKKSGSISHGTVSSTVTVYTYKWDEFQATTAEKVGDAYYLYYNTFKYYYSGDTTTPMNRWILSKRFQGSQILAENIGK